MAIQAVSRFDRVPPEILLHILSFLRPEELGNAAKVCRLWRVFAYDNSLWRAIERSLENRFSSLSIIDASTWKAHIDVKALGLQVEDEIDVLPFTKRASLLPSLKVLKGFPCSHIEGNAGMTLLTIPKGLTFNKLLALASSPKKGEPVQMRYLWDRISIDLGDIPVLQAYKVVIANSILKESKNLSDIEHRTLVNRVRGEMPGVLELSTLAILTYMTTFTRLFNDSPMVFTRCGQEIEELSLIGGGFSLEGLVFKSLEDIGSNCGVGIQKRV